MADYLKVTGASGSVQIDDRYFNYAIIASGQLQLNPQPAGNAYYPATGTVRITAKSPMIAIAPSAAYAFVGAVTSVGNGQWDVTILGGSQTITFYVLDQCPQQGMPAAPGFRVHRADQSVAFDSRLYYPKVVFFGSGPKNDLPAGSYAVICAKSGGRIAVVTNINTEYTTAYQTTSTGVIVAADFPLRQWPAGINMNATSSAYMIIDITNVFI